MPEQGDVPLTVVMPAYNEEQVIERAVQEVQQDVLDRIGAAELVVVDDGSRDETGAILDRLAAQDTRLQVIHQPNRGHGPALRAGLDAARGTYVLLLDSDRQIPLDSFEGCWSLAREHDGVFGARAFRQDPFIRLMVSAAVRRVVRLLFGVRLRDANVPFKMFRRSLWLEARPIVPEETLTPSLFLGIYMWWRGLDVVEREVGHRRRQTGAVSLRRWTLFTFCLRAFRQLLLFRKRLATVERGTGGGSLRHIPRKGELAKDQHPEG
ncbi:MAG: glycosyltransferase family 2 protein [Rhodothermales bacterium]